MRDTSKGRLTGRRLQAARLRIWTACPNCAECGRLTAWPRGFDLDHKVPLFKGGTNDDANLQVLCNGPDGCHERKTCDDQGFVYRAGSQVDGTPRDPRHHWNR